jgi:glycerophosphoryl diester phosphodiesterase
LFDDFVTPIIVAHRGASLVAPENTIAAFEAAVRQNADAVELDVQLTGDGELIVLHDDTLDRTTNGTGKVSQSVLQMIKELDAGAWFGDAFKKEPVPTLADVFEAIGRKTFINIELKNYSSPFDDLAEKVAQLVKRHNLENQVFFSSFNPFALRAAKRQLPNVPTGFLTLKGLSRSWIESLVENIAPFDAIHPHLSDISPQTVHRAKQNGKKLFTYTVNTPQEIVAITNLGVNGIITDDPLLAREVLSSPHSPT